jgi:IS5 family transposase
MKQPSFSDMAYDQKKKKTRKEQFLGEMDQVLPWDVLLAPVLEHYPKAGNGRRPIGAEVMLRIYFMQQWYALSDPAMEDSLYDVESMRRFAGVDLNGVPDETTICKFRHLLEAHDLTAALFEQTRRYLSDRGLMLREGSIVDATIIHAPSSTKNKAGKRDPEMASTKKGNTFHFGMKAHVGTDTKGRVHSVATTKASVHDAQAMEACLHGEEQVIYGDKAYADQGRKERAEARGITWRVHRKANRGRRLTCADRSFNKKSNRVRARVEHPFGVIKNLWGYRKVKYRGLAKNTAQLLTLFALANFHLVRRELAVT